MHAEIVGWGRWSGAHVQGLALGAGGVEAEGLLAALVAGHAGDPVIDALACGCVVPVHEELPEAAGHMRSRDEIGAHPNIGPGCLNTP